MRVEIFKDYQELSDAAASAIINQVKLKPNSVLCFASGDTPKLALHKTVERAKKEDINFSRIFFIDLDEWVGIAPDEPGNCGNFFREIFLSPLKISEDQYHLFNGMATDLDQECKEMDEVILKKGGIDLMLVGLGMNGHIGFNEPGTSPELSSFVSLLDEETKSVGQKYFQGEKHLEKGLTLGFKHLMEARKVILMANGKHKSEIVRKALEEGISTTVPATILRKHDNGIVMLDEAAASILTHKEKDL